MPPWWRAVTQLQVPEVSRDAAGFNVSIPVVSSDL